MRELSHLARVVVVDDGSKDSTGAVAESMGAFVVSLPKNAGYDMALLAGIKSLMSEPITGFVTCDADGQHLPEDVARALDLVTEGRVIIGNRGDSIRLSEKVFGYFSNRLFGVKDPLCGLKGYALADVDESSLDAMVGSSGTGLALDLIAKGASVVNFDIQPQNRRHGRPRFGGVLSANVKIAFSLIRRLRAVRT